MTDETNQSAEGSEATPVASTTAKPKAKRSGGVPKGILAAAKVNDAELARAVSKHVGVAFTEKDFRRNLRAKFGKQNVRTATHATVAKYGIEWARDLKAKRSR